MTYFKKPLPLTYRTLLQGLRLVILMAKYAHTSHRFLTQKWLFGSVAPLLVNMNFLKTTLFMQTWCPMAIYTNQPPTMNSKIAVARCRYYCCSLVVGNLTVRNEILCSISKEIFCFSPLQLTCWNKIDVPHEKKLTKKHWGYSFVPQNPTFDRFCQIWHTKTISRSRCRFLGESFGWHLDFLLRFGVCGNFFR